MVDMSRQVLKERCFVESGFPAPAHTSILYKAWCDWLPKVQDDCPPDDNASIFNLLMDQTYIKGRFAITNNGLMATLPSRTKCGDQICIIPGLSKPLLLRPLKRRAQGDFADTWEFIGDCYVHGLMTGGALARPHDTVDLLLE
jgi:hypothetical protein